MPKCSVIIPYYNRLDWTIQAVTSVIGQTWKDFEIILVDDGSEHSIDVSIFNDARVKHFVRPHKGASAARNYGISVASGEYITFLDSDDLYLPSKLERQIALFSRNPKTGLVYCYISLMSVNGCPKPNTGFHSKLVGHIYPAMLLIAKCFLTTPAVMIKRDILDEVGIFDEEMTVCEDLDLWRRVLRVTNADVVEDTLVYVRDKAAKPTEFIESIVARTYYYDKAFREDRQLPTSFRRLLNKEMNDIYWGTLLYHSVQPSLYMHYAINALATGRYEYLSQYRGKIPKISIILTVSNSLRAKHILECLSIIELTNFELLVVGSDQDDVLPLFVDKTIPRLGIRYYQQNGDVAKQRNFAIPMALGKYILFLDENDEVNPEYIRLAINLLDSTPQYSLIYQSDTKEALHGFVASSVLLSFPCPVSLSNAIIRREVISDVGFFDESLTCLADLDYLYRISKKYYFYGLYIASCQKKIYSLSNTQISDLYRALKTYSNKLLRGGDVHCRNLIDRMYHQIEHEIASSEVLTIAQKNIPKIYKLLDF